jgi:hypothetical protein
MSLELPKFADEHLIFVKACARITKPDKNLVEWINAERKDDDDDDGRLLEVMFETTRGRAFMLLIANEVERKDQHYVHFHINCAREDFFENRDKSLPETKIEDGEEFFSHFDGKECRGILLGSIYNVSYDELPKRGAIELLLGAETNLSGAKAIITGAQVKFQETETIIWREMNWNAQDDEEEIRVRMEGFVPDYSVTRDYLTEIEQLCVNGFQRYVLERPHSDD